NIGEHPTITDTFRNANNLKDDGHKAKVITEAIVFMV
ncbi:hypothetical protein ACLKA7_001749, partial [Drosophila subpalustris]